MRTILAILVFALSVTGQERAAQVQCGSATLSSNAITCTPSPALTAYADGQVITGRVAGAANTDSTTINVSSLGALTLKKLSSGAYANLASGDLIVGQPFACVRATNDCLLTTPVATSPASSGGLNPRTTSEHIEDFLGGSTTSPNLGTLGWAWAGGSATMLAAETGSPGIIQRSTGGTINTVAYLTVGSQQTQLSPGDAFDLTWRVRLNQTDSDTVARIGLNCGSASALQPASGIWFERGGSDSTWQAVTRTVNVETKQNTTVNVGTAWTIYRIQRSGGNILFSIDDTLTNTISTNIPTAGCSVWTVISNLAAASKTMDHDYAWIKITGLSR